MATPPDFSVGQVLTAAQMNAVGLWLVKTQTIGSAVSSVTVTDAFSADYDAYKIFVSGGVFSTTMNVTFQLGPSSVTNYNTLYYYRNIGLSWAGAAADISGANTSTIQYAGVGTVNDISLNIEVINPHLAKFTHFNSTRVFSSAVGDAQNMAAVHRQASSFTDFKIEGLSGGTFTGGTIYVYGYRN